MTPQDDRLRRLMMILRQACYFIADELSTELRMYRRCKVCEQRVRPEPPRNGPNKAA